MIKDPVFLLAYRAGVVGLLQVFRLRRPGLFARLPIAWSYFIPTPSASAGLNPHDGALHHERTRYLMAACLVSLLLPATPRRATTPVVIAAGGLEVALARVRAFPILPAGLPTEAREAAGALPGTRIGGANLVAAVTTLAFSPERPVAPARARPAA